MLGFLWTINYSSYSSFISKDTWWLELGAFITIMVVMLVFPYFSLKINLPSQKTALTKHLRWICTPLWYARYKSIWNENSILENQQCAWYSADAQCSSSSSYIFSHFNQSLAMQTRLPFFFMIQMSQTSQSYSQTSFYFKRFAWKWWLHPTAEFQG